MDVLWMAGPYPHFTTFQTSVMGLGTVAPAPRASTTVRIDLAAARIVAGSSVRVSARLVNARGEALAGREVTLLSRAPGLTRWSRVAELRTPADGLVHFRPVPEGSTEYSVRWPGDQVASSSSSPVVTVRSVRRASTIALRTPVSAGVRNEITVSGILRDSGGSPIAQGLVQVLSRTSDASRFTVVGEVRTRSDGRLQHTVALRASTTVWLRYNGGPRHTGSSSAVRRVSSH